MSDEHSQHAGDLRRMLEQNFQGPAAPDEASIGGLPEGLAHAWIDETLRLAAADDLLDAELNRQLAQLGGLAAAIASREESFLDIGSHPLQQLIDTVYERCYSWHAGLERAGQALQQQLDQSIGHALEWYESGDAAIAQALDELVTFLNTQEQAAQKLQDRVVDGELGKLKAASARLTAARSLNDLMRNRQLPPGMIDFLQGVWFDSLQLIAILHGPGSEQWSRALRLTIILINSVQPIDADDTERRQQLYSQIPRIPAELRKQMLSLQNDDAEAEAALAVIEDIHHRVLRKRAQIMREPEPIDLGPAATRSKVSKQMLGQIDALDLGQWFLIRQENGPPLRMKLALKMQDYFQLLFVNRSGGRALHKSYEEFAYLLAASIATPLSPAPLFSRCLQRAAGAPFAATPAESVDETVNTALIETDEAAIGTAPAVPEAQSEPLEPEPAIELALQPAEPTPAIYTPEPAAMEQAAAINTPVSAAKELHVGDWVVFSDTDPARMCKLAVRIFSRDMYLFVNTQGKREREMNLAEYAALVAAGQVEYIEDETRFEQAVATIVHSFRNTDPTEE